MAVMVVVRNHRKKQLVETIVKSSSKARNIKVWNFLVTFFNLATLLCTCNAQVNIALNQNAWQNFTKTVRYPELALDGNTSPLFSSGSCSHTLEYQPNPWWVVDLQFRRLVGNVRIINRNDCCGERLRHVRIGVTDNHPLNVTPTMANIEVCYCHDPSLGDITELYCGAWGQYLVILLEGQEETLVLCEVQVFEGEVTTPEMPVWLPGFRLSQNTTLSRCGLESVTGEQQRDWFSCFARCLRNPCCQAVNITGCKWSGFKTEDLDFVREDN